MYLLKAKHKEEEKERLEVIERRRKAKEDQRRRQQGHAPERRTPKPMIHKAAPDEKSKGHSKKAKYLGSFSVPTAAGRAQAGVVKQGLAKLEVRRKPKAVIVVVQKEGVKILSEDETRVYMAHAMFRISYTTIIMEKHYFAFVGKNPGGGTAASFCHVFRTDKKEDAQELNKRVGNAFKEIFAEQRERTMKRDKKRDNKRSPSPAVAGSDMGTPAPVLSSQPVIANSEPPPLPSKSKMLKAKLKPEEPLKPTQQCSLPSSTFVEPSAPVFNDEEALRTAEWYQGGLPRDIAVEILSQESDGAFIVRDSQSQPGRYVLSMKCPAKPGEQSGSIANYLIVRMATGLNLKGLSSKCFPNLPSLVAYHANHQEGLPCQLHLHSSNPVFAAEEDGIEDELKSTDPDFSSAANFDMMLADLQTLST